MRRILLAYHRPGKPREEERVEQLAQTVAMLARGRLAVDTMVVDEVDEAAGERYDAIYLLMFTRGGHWLSVIEATGRTPRLIPLHLTATILASRAAETGARRLLLLGLRARRLEHLQLEDLGRLSLLLAAWKLEMSYQLLEAIDSQPKPQEKWCRSDTLVAPLALLDGKLADHARALAEACGAAQAGPLLHHSAPAIAAWIAEDAAHPRA